MILLYENEFEVVRDEIKCIRCKVCVCQCVNEVYEYDEEEDRVVVDLLKCVVCYRCVVMCLIKVFIIKKIENVFKENVNWILVYINEIYKQVEIGGIFLIGMGNDKLILIYWDRFLINVSQVINLLIDFLRELMEFKIFIGRKFDKFEFDENGNFKIKFLFQFELEVFIMFFVMLFGLILFNVCEFLVVVVVEVGIYWNIGEGGFYQKFYKYKERVIVQCVLGRFGVDVDYLNVGVVIEIKIGQGVKLGIGGYLFGEKVGEEVLRIRMILIGFDVILLVLYYDIYLIEDLCQFIFVLKEVINYIKFVGVKIVVVYNVVVIVFGIVRVGVDFIIIDGVRGGIGVVLFRIRDNVGILIEFVLVVVDLCLREEGIRNQVLIIVVGLIRNSSDVVKVIVFGVDVVYIGIVVFILLGCYVCQKCYIGKCNWGIVIQDFVLVKRFNFEIGVRRVVNFLKVWSYEIKEMLGFMGINVLESLRGNRFMFRVVGFIEKEMEILGVKYVGEGVQVLVKKIFLKEDVCVGCYLCEVYCVYVYFKYKKLNVKVYEFVKFYIKYKDLKLILRILVEEKSGIWIIFVLQCRYCDDVLCIKVCIIGVMKRFEDGRIVCDEEKCVGCWLCIMVCLYGVV